MDRHLPAQERVADVADALIREFDERHVAEPRARAIGIAYERDGRDPTRDEFAAKRRAQRTGRARHEYAFATKIRNPTPAHAVPFGSKGMPSPLVHRYHTPTVL